jgi:non-ribosomal peptide synthetase component E (peptide arylation enzyme)
MFMAPPIARMVFDDPELRDALTVLRRVVWTLGKLPAEMRATFETETCRIQQLYGQGEGLCMVTPADAPAELRHTTVGVPISPFDEVRIYRPSTEDEVDPGEAGELCCRGPYTVRGYFRGGERNAEAFTSDGFYRSGDIAVAVDAPGGPYYAIEDRLKDVISRGGEKINALEVEELLVRHPSVKAAALAAMPDDRLGERACAFVVLETGAPPVDVPELQRFLDGLAVAKFKWPERVVITDTLPLTNVDKVNKAALRAEIARILDAEA